MIDLYYWTTPNGHKITLFLEEAGLPYTIHPVNISRGDQFKPEFLAISPNNRIPAIVDKDPGDGGAPVSVFESGAILVYLAEKTGRFLPQDLHGRMEALAWLFWQVGGLGPMAGQNHHFRQYAREKLSYAIERYVNETNRLYGVLNKRLASNPPDAAGESPIMARGNREAAETSFNPQIKFKIARFWPSRSPALANQIPPKWPKVLAQQ